MIDRFAALIVLALPLAAGSSGCALMLLAGRYYARGELVRARTLGRLGGWWLCAGGLCLGLGAALAALSGAALAGASALPGAGMVGLAGAIGLLGGLSGKPVPAGGAATLFFLAGAACLAAAA